MASGLPAVVKSGSRRQQLDEESQAVGNAWMGLGVKQNKQTKKRRFCAVY